MLRVGTSGWSHAHWVGPFYPVSLREDPSAWLAYYASRFRCVEINSTFDAFPDADLVAAWARQGLELSAAAPPFEFSVKLPRECTHDALPAGDVERAWEVAARFERHVLEPLADDGLLGAVVVQLPPTLGPEHAQHVHEMLRALSGRLVALEPRDPRWLREGRIAPEVQFLFSGSGDVALVEADAPVPGLRGVPPARHAYVRLHGRRADVWGRTDRPLDGTRYDYLYLRDELAPLVERIRAHEAAERDVRVVFNNAPRGKAAKNALDLLDMMGAAPNVPRPRLTEQKRLSV